MSEARITQKDIQQENVESIESALDWVMSQSKDGVSCPFCGWRAVIEGKEAPDKLRAHLSNQHTYKVIQTHSQGNLEARPIADDPQRENLMESLGLEVMDDLDHFDMLRVPTALRRKITNDGSNVRWVAPRNVQRYKDAGMELVNYDQLTSEERESLDLHNHGSDGHFKANEMFLMRIPPRTRDRLARVRNARQLNVGIARKEELERRVEGVQRQVHDRLRQRGYDSTQARNVAGAVAKRMMVEGRVDVTRG